jgi:hypothetical protein
VDESSIEVAEKVLENSCFCSGEVDGLGGQMFEIQVASGAKVA